MAEIKAKLAAPSSNADEEENRREMAATMAPAKQFVEDYAASHAEYAMPRNDLVDELCYDRDLPIFGAWVEHNAPVSSQWRKWPWQ